MGGGATEDMTHKALGNAVTSDANAATELVMENGAVAGVKVKNDAGEYTIKAKAVILASGGFGVGMKVVEQGGSCWAIFDQSMIDGMADVREYYEMGLYESAATIEELAAKIGVDAVGECAYVGTNGANPMTVDVVFGGIAGENAAAYVAK